MGERGRESEGPTDGELGPTDGGGASVCWAPTDLHPIARRERGSSERSNGAADATGLQTPMGSATKAGEPTTIELGSGSHQKQQR